MSCQLKDVFDHVRQCHRLLKAKLNCVLITESDPRLQLLLRYIARHEQHIEETLRQYEASAANGLLNTWIKYRPDESLNSALSEVKFNDTMSADEILAAVLEFDSLIIDVFKDIANSTPIPSVQELFVNLLRMEENQDCQYSLSVLQQNDV